MKEEMEFYSKTSSTDGNTCFCVTKNFPPFGWKYMLWCVLFLFHAVYNSLYHSVQSNGH